MKIEVFYDKTTFTLTYLIFDEATKDAIVIDPVLDYDQYAGKLSHTSFEKVHQFIQEKKLNLQYVLETHAHADHLSSSQIFKDHYPNVKIGIGEHIKVVQETFKGVFNLVELNISGEQFDHLFKDGEVLKIGPFEIKVINTPGHTPACVSYLIEDHLFTGDALFMPDFGTGRCDFPKGCAEDLYHSIHEKLYELPDETKVYVGHDYQPGGRELMYQTTIGESKKSNIQLKAETSREDFVSFRKARDATLSAPKLLLPSIQVNIDAGKLPKAEKNGVSYIKLPLT